MFCFGLDYYDFTRVGGLIGHLTKNMPLPEADIKQAHPIPLEIELVDDLVFLHHLGMSSRFKSASMHLQNQLQAISQLTDVNKRIKIAQEKVLNAASLIIFRTQRG